MESDQNSAALFELSTALFNSYMAAIKAARVGSASSTFDNIESKLKLQIEPLLTILQTSYPVEEISNYCDIRAACGHVKNIDDFVLLDMNYHCRTCIGIVSRSVAEQIIYKSTIPPPSIPAQPIVPANPALNLPNPNSPPIVSTAPPASMPLLPHAFPQPDYKPNVNPAPQAIDTSNMKKCWICEKLKDLDVDYLESDTCKDLCIDCLTQQIRTKKVCCPKCSNAYSPALFNQINRFNEKCGGKCGRNKNILTEFSRFRCADHILCKGCLFESVFNEKCQVCDRFYSNQEIIGIKMLMESRIEGVEESRLQCPVCYSTYSPLEMLHLWCGCVFCPLCLKEYLENLIDQNKLHGEGMLCPKCQIPINSELLEAMIDPVSFDRFNNLMIKKQYSIITCRRCNGDFECEDDIANCPHCSYSFCTKCLRDSHRGPCDDGENTMSRCKMLDESGIVYSQCPRCLTPYMKDEGCEHVKCASSDCGIDFCYKCSAVRSPILAHGNHYHRPACPYFSEFTGQNVSSQNCSECMLAGSLCAAPADTVRLGKFF